MPLANGHQRLDLLHAFPGLVTGLFVLSRDLQETASISDDVAVAPAEQLGLVGYPPPHLNAHHGVYNHIRSLLTSFTYTSRVRLINSACSHGLAALPGHHIEL